MAKLELLIEDLSEMEGFGALLAYRGAVRDLRTIVEHAGAGDRSVISRMTSVGLALEGLVRGLGHVARLRGVELDGDG